MKIARRLTAAAGVLALSSGLAVVAGPAQAEPERATTPVVTVKVKVYGDRTNPRYGDFVSVVADAKGPAGQYLTGGSVQIQMAAAGSSAWRNVGDRSGTHTSYSLGALTRPVQFRAIYSGGVSGHPAVDYAATGSATAVIGTVDRGRMLIRSTRKRVCYRVGPAPYKNKAVKHYVKLGASNKWRLAGVDRTDKNSRYCYKVGPGKASANNRKVKARKTVYAKSGGMAKSVHVRSY